MCPLLVDLVHPAVELFKTERVSSPFQFVLIAVVLTSVVAKACVGVVLVATVATDSCVSL